MARLQKGFFPHSCLLYLLLGTYAMFHPSKSKMEKNITDKDSHLSTVKMLRSTDFTQSDLTWSRAEQELLLQSLLYLEKLYWLPSLFCVLISQRSEEVCLMAWEGDLQRCSFYSPYIPNSCLSSCSGAGAD